ncbi:MAG: F0F1 ATP synthase subunit B [Clostridiales bacterium]|nr:F0F1 ATP synthase subunit B [Clostridiales bacterium]
MQSLDIISVNIWQIIISLCNLVILFFIVKKFLYKPVKELIAEREAATKKIFDEANEAKLAAEKDKAEWEAKLKGAKGEADAIIKNAMAKADHRGETIIKNAQERADGIIRQAKIDAELEQKKAEDGIKREIIDLSAVLAKKMLKREINEDDHRELIDDFLFDIGEMR